VHGAAGQRSLDPGQPDQRRLVAVRLEQVDAAVGHDDARDVVANEPVEHLAEEVGGGLLGTPRGRDDLESGLHVVHACPVEHHHVVRPLGGEQRTGVHRRRVERIVVAGKQVHRNADGAHGLERLTHVARRELVVLEDVAGHDDELRARLRRKGAEPGDRVASRRRITRLRLAVEEVARHAELPVGGVQEAHPAPFSSSVDPRRFDGHGECRSRPRQVGGPHSACVRRTRRAAVTVGPVSLPDRTLLLLRHAKSDYPDGVADHDRPLAPRGVREAALAGDWIRANVGDVDAVLCSTATRTRQTLARTGIEAPVRYDDDLYDSTPGTVLRLVNGVGDAAATLLVVGHEPTTSMLALGLAADDGSDPAVAARISSKFPTSAIAVLRTTTPWHRLELHSATLVDFHVPR
jgi:phosphohistidine phosphatase